MHALIGVVSLNQLNLKSSLRPKDAAQSRKPKASMRPMRMGSGNSDAVSNSSAIAAFEPRLMSSFRQGQAIISVIGSFLGRALWIGAGPPAS